MLYQILRQPVALQCLLFPISKILMIMEFQEPNSINHLENFDSENVSLGYDGDTEVNIDSNCNKNDDVVVEEFILSKSDTIVDDNVKGSFTSNMGYNDISEGLSTGSSGNNDVEGLSSSNRGYSDTEGLRSSNRGNSDEGLNTGVCSSGSNNAKRVDHY